MKRVLCLVWVALAAIGGAAVPALCVEGGPKQEGPQSEVASKNVKFEVVTRTFRGFKEAHEATDAGNAKKLVGKPSMFKGTVLQVATTKGNTMVVLQFAKDPKSAVRAVVHQENFFRFPKLEDLKGKLVLFTAKVLDSEEGPEVVLIRPGQLKIVE